MPRRKADATEGDVTLPASNPSGVGTATDGADDATVVSQPDEAPVPDLTAPAQPEPTVTTDVPAESLVLPPDAEGPADEPLLDVVAADSDRDPSDEVAYSEPLVDELYRVAPPIDLDDKMETDAPETVIAAGPPEPPAAADELHDTEDESGSSFATKLLTALVLLLLGGGIGLWAAPKLAPHLPSGMAGVANWLTPGASDTDARIAALETQVGERLDSIDGRLGGFATADDADQKVTAAVDAASKRFDGEIAAVKESLEQSDTGDLPQQLARVQSLLDGQGAELATLKQQLSGTEASTGQLSQQAVEKIDVYRAELDGLRAEVGTLQDRVAGLATKVDEAEQRADREVETAQTRVEAIQTEAATQLTSAQADANVAMIRAAIESGTPFEAPLAVLQGQSGVTVPQGLVDAAPDGVVSMAKLRDDFADTAHAAISASVMASAGDGLAARTRAFFGAQVASRSLTPQEGSSPDAVLSRVEDRLRQGDLDDALAEAGQLPSEAQTEMAPWLSAARLRAGAVDGLTELETSLAAAN